MKSYHNVVSQIETLLVSRGVSYSKFEHEPVRTSEEAAAIRPGYTQSQGAKALIIRVKKNGATSYAMVVVPGDKKFNSAKVRAVLQASDIRFATPEEVGNITGGVVPGGVPPFGNLWDLPVVADETLFQNEEIIFSAGDRRVSIALPSDIYKHIVHPTIEKVICIEKVSDSP
jgi:prolyl-tRNA editing enzyme YbaK/EbsC (Cys-tRNA(Pro) deacylase)